MQISVLVEPVANNGYRARGGEPVPLEAEGATPEEAIDKFKAQLRDRLSNGAKLVTVEVDPEVHPLAKFAGMFKDDPYFAEVIEIMAENRRKMDADPDIL